MSADDAFEQVGILRTIGAFRPRINVASHQERRDDMSFNGVFPLCEPGGSSLRSFVIVRFAVGFARRRLIESTPDAPNFLLTIRSRFKPHVISLEDVEERHRQSAVVFALKVLFGFLEALEYVDGKPS